MRRSHDNLLTLPHQLNSQLKQKHTSNKNPAFDHFGILLKTIEAT
jgi:hypothetical protein